MITIKDRQLSIQTKLMLFITIPAAFILIFIGLFFFRSIRLSVNASKEKELITLANETSNKIDRFLFERYGDIEVMAKSPVIKNDNISNDLKLQYLNTVRSSYKTYDFIAITDKTGKIKLISGKFIEEKNYSEWINKVLKDKTLSLDFFINKTSKDYSVYFAAPILNDNGSINGAVIERMNFASIANIIQSVNPGKSGFAYMQNSNKAKIFYPENNSGTLSISNNTNLYYPSFNKIKYIAATAKIKQYKNQENSWYLVVQEPYKEAFNIAYSLKIYIIVIIIISLSAMLILSYIMSGYIANPIKKLVSETSSVAEGNIRDNVTIHSTDEVGKVAESFNMLLSDLNSMMKQFLEISGEYASFTDIRNYINKYFDKIPGAIITIDSSGNITTFNKVAEEVTGIKFTDINEINIKSNSLNENLKNIQSILILLRYGLENKEICKKQIVTIKSEDKNEIPVIINTSVQRDLSGKVLGVVGVFRKADEIRKFEQNILRAKNLESLGKMSARLSHEIRNPLTSIKGYAQYIKSELNDKIELTEDIDIIINEVNRLNGLIDRFLTFANPKKPDLELCNLNNAIEEVINLLNISTKNNKIKIEKNLGHISEVNASFDAIKQVVLNISENSIQAMPDGGTLTLSTRMNDNNSVLEIEISDTGSGIASCDYEKIFEPFYTTKSKGTGLGLAICSNIIESHNGLIEVMSTLKVGTKFIIKLPVKI